MFLYNSRVTKPRIHRRHPELSPVDLSSRHVMFLLQLNSYSIKVLGAEIPSHEIIEFSRITVIRYLFGTLIGRRGLGCIDVSVN